MKQSDYLIILVVVVISIVLAIILPKDLFSRGSLNQVEQVPIIRSYFPKPQSKYFNKSSIDLSPYIKISNNNNKQPFITTTIN